MNKKLLTAAIGAALVAGPMLAAQAKVTVYGMAQVEVSDESVDNVTTGLGMNDDDFVRTSNWNFGSNKNATDDSALTTEDNARGRIGVKVKEDLGGGLKGIAKFEWKVDTTQGGRDTGQRESFVGLQGSWGTFKAGRLRTPYKYYGGVKYDPFVATNLEARRNGGMSGGGFTHNGFAPDTLGYISPKKKGPVQFWAVISLDEQGGGGGLASGGWDDGDYSFGAKFSQKSWEVFVATIKNKHNTTGTAQDFTATKVGGMWKSGPHKIVAQFEDWSIDNFPTASDDVENLFVGYHFKFGGNNTLVVQIGDGDLAEQSGAGGTQEWTYTTVGVIHKFSKKTRVFAGISNTSLDNAEGVAGANNERDVISIGLRKDF